MQHIRGVVKENTLSNPDLVRYDDYTEYLFSRGKGWVCEANGHLVGFAIADLQANNIWALFVLPGYEGKGIARMLQKLMLHWYFAQGKNSVWLSTSPGTRAEKFYHETGWKETGPYGKNEIRLEMSWEQWIGLRKNL